MNITWTTERRKLSDLNPAEYNPRQLTEKQAKDLSTSLERFNLADPIIINQNNRIIGGHQRINILRSRGVDEVDVRVPNRLLGDKEERELNIRLNRNLGEWDFDALANFDEELLKDAGFDSKDLDRIFQLDADEKDDVVPEDAPAIAKAGDIYQLGRHRVMCGDSTKAEDVAKLMGGGKADMVFTDPPYNTGMEGKAGSTWLSHMFKDNFTEADWEKFLDQAFNSYLENTKSECVFYVCIDWRRVSDIKNALSKIMKVSNVIVWDKMVHGLGSDYKYTYELIVVAKRGSPEINNRFGEDYRDVWHVQRKVGRNKDHATAKPIDLCVKPILHGCKQDDIVLDLFLGSGSTLIACEKTNRICYGMEIDPKYVDVIIKRWEDFTSLKSVKVE